MVELNILIKLNVKSNLAISLELKALRLPVRVNTSQFLKNSNVAFTMAGRYNSHKSLEVNDSIGTDQFIKK